MSAGMSQTIFMPPQFISLSLILLLTAGDVHDVGAAAAPADLGVDFQRRAAVERSLQLRVCILGQIEAGVNLGGMAQGDGPWLILCSAVNWTGSSPLSSVHTVLAVEEKAPRS